MERAELLRRPGTGLSMPEREGNDEEKGYLRAAEAAALLHVSPKTVSRWAKEGKLPHVVTLGGHRRFPRKEIERLVRNQTDQP